MSDITFDKFMHYGTNAQRLAFTPTPASGVQPLYFWYETDTGALYFYDTTWHALSVGSAAISTIPSVFDHRLTLETGVPVSTTDQTGKSNVYLTPYKGTSMSLFNGTSWIYYVVPEIALILSGLTSGKNYDIFAFASSATPSATDTGTDIVTFASATGWNTGARVIPASTGGGLTGGTTYFWNAASGTTGSFHTTLADALTAASKVNLTANITQSLTTVSLELSAAWTTDTARADALTTQDGVYVKSGATTRRHVGTLRTTAATTTEDSAAKRFLWSAYNQVRRHMRVIDTTDSWAYTTATWRQANGSAANQLAFVIGYQQSLTASIAVSTNNGNGPNRAISVGEDSTTTPSTIKAFTSGVTSEPLYVPYNNMLSAGYHFLAWLEYSGVGGTTTWYGDAGVTFVQSGISGDIWN